MALAAALAAGWVSAVVHARLPLTFAVAAVVCVVAFVLIEVFLTHPARRRLRVTLISDCGLDRIRLILVNRGDRAEFAAKVIKFADERGQEIDPQSWAIPWDGQGGTAAREILRHDRGFLDFARFDWPALRREMGSGHWGDPHWFFSTGGKPVTVAYRWARAMTDLEAARFTAVARVTGSAPGRPVDFTLRIGFRDRQPVCEVAATAPAPPSPAAPRERPMLHVRVAASAHWRDWGDRSCLEFMAAVVNPTGRPIEVRRMWVCGATGDGAQERTVRNLPGLGYLRPVVIAPHGLASGLRLEEVPHGWEEAGPLTFVVMDAGNNTYTAPVPSPEPVQPVPGSART